MISPVQKDHPKNKFTFLEPQALWPSGKEAEMVRKYVGPEGILIKTERTDVCPDAEEMYQYLKKRADARRKIVRNFYHRWMKRLEEKRVNFCLELDLSVGPLTNKQKSDLMDRLDRAFAFLTIGIRQMLPRKLKRSIENSGGVNKFKVFENEEGEIMCMWVGGGDEDNFSSLAVNDTGLSGIIGFSAEIFAEVLVEELFQGNAELLGGFKKDAHSSSAKVAYLFQTEVVEKN